MSSSVLPLSVLRTRVQSGSAPLPALRAVKLLDRLRERIRLMHYSRRTEETYVHWCRAFIRFHGLRHPVEMGQQEVEAFLTHLAVQRQVAVSMHRQASRRCSFCMARCWKSSCLGWRTSVARCPSGDCQWC